MENQDGVLAGKDSSERLEQVEGRKEVGSKGIISYQGIQPVLSITPGTRRSSGGYSVVNRRIHVQVKFTEQKGK